MAVCSLWHFPRVTPPGRYPAPCPVESGLSSTRNGPRPPGRLLRDQFTSWPPLAASGEQLRRGVGASVALARPRQPFVDTGVRQPISIAVELPRNVLELHALESLHQGPGLGVQTKKSGVLDPPPPGQLLDQQLAI